MKNSSQVLLELFSCFMLIYNKCYSLSYRILELEDLKKLSILLEFIIGGKS